MSKAKRQSVRFSVLIPVIRNFGQWLDSEFTDISELADMFIVACNFTDAQTQDLMGDGWHCGSCQPIFDELAKKIKEGSNAD